MNKTKRNIALVAICPLLVILYLGLSHLYWGIKTVYDPDGITRVRETFEKMPSDNLLKRINSIDPISPYPGVAIRVLADRKESKAVPVLIRLTRSLHAGKRHQAIIALGNIGDEDAVDRLLEIVGKGDIRSNPDYQSALYSLCQIGYKPARPYVIEMLRRPDGINNGSVAMIKYIGEKEDLQILEDMLARIRGNDVNARLDRKSIETAISAIKDRKSE